MDAWFISLIDKYDQYGVVLFVALTCLVSGLLASVIGLERELKGQSAGLRTHVLVSFACSLLMSISVFAIRKLTKDTEFSNLAYDASRIAAGILGGIGFMGAGTIVKTGLNIRGLTTAGTIWFSAALGMACGSGFILEAIIVTLICMVFLIGLSYVEKMLEKRCPRVVFFTTLKIDVFTFLKEEASNYGLVVKNIRSSYNILENDCKEIEYSITFAYQSSKKLLHGFVEKLAALDGVKNVYIMSKRDESL